MVFWKAPRPRAFRVGAIFCHVEDHLFVTVWTIVGMILWTICLSLFGSLLGTILGPIFGPELQRPKKATFSKKWFSRWTVCIFSLLRPPKELLNPKKRDPKLTQKSTNFEPILGFEMGSKICP